MLWSFLAWKVLKLSLLISIILSLAFMLFQLLRIDKILFSLPLEETLPFLMLWTSYSLFYFMPTSMFISSSVVFFELKDSKKLHVIESFGIAPYLAYSRVFVRCMPIFISLIAISFMLREEDVSFMRRYLTYKYYMNMVYSVPEKTFFTLGDMTFYVSERNGNDVSDVFFKKGESLVIAKGAHLDSDAIVFTDGSILVKEGEKFYLTAFSQYRISLEKFVSVERQQRNLKRDQILNLVNTALSPLLMTFGFFISRVITDAAIKLYYLVGVLSILYQFFLIILKSLL
ncbi:permease YjgP/YjgQ family protein [Hydrogenobacter thermophilus TK-6]|uniref:Permease n=1 Tax=Hydrogenobacter thermophilus (strain DSM 6534 / IAM 12695 / TK-6) TaxID=608538 RepID=D3DJE8_HYDTT|nr:LptF/LptG family permease [Hydrogenobacter thermophilus]ADO45872.1 permease YjgP/YjgQ family protein [Hydrogenobacter thermophilus TK-6]BAI69950.1 hypothetical protein HTH_1500 [Hydrogenobacter thermophilus TK-6]